MSGLGAERSFGALLRSARLDAALTQQDLATRCGMSVRAISDLERNRTRRPYLRSVRLLAEALNVPRPLRDAMLAASEQLVEAVAKTAALAEALTDLRVHASRTERDHRADPPAGNGAVG